MGNIEAIQELIDIFTNNGNEEEAKKYIIKLNNLKVAQNLIICFKSKKLLT